MSTLITFLTLRTQGNNCKQSIKATCTEIFIATVRVVLPYASIH